MSTPRGYSSYHGRTSPGKIFLIILLVLVIAAASVFLLLQRYIVYDASGTPHLELPQKESLEEAAASVSASSSADAPLNVTVEKPQGAETLTGVQLSADPASWLTAANSLTSAGENAYCVTMKASGGAVEYESAVTGASLSKTAQAASAELPALLGTDAWSVARISCLRDSAYARANLDAAGLKNTGDYLFYDGNNENWLDPAKQGTQDYLSALAGECAQMGFQEILLTDLSYPTKGKLSKINAGGAPKSENLKALVTAVKAALAQYGVKLSVELPAEVISNGVDADAGLSLSDIAPLVDRVYAQAAADQVPALREAVKAASAQTDFVAEAAAAVSGGSSLLVTG